MHPYSLCIHMHCTSNASNGLLQGLVLELSPLSDRRPSSSGTLHNSLSIAFVVIVMYSASYYSENTEMPIPKLLFFTYSLITQASHLSPVTRPARRSYNTGISYHDSSFSAASVFPLLIFLSSFWNYPVHHLVFVHFSAFPLLLLYRVLTPASFTL